MDFTMEKQRRTFWCWTAVAASVSKYYDNKSQWAQCLVVQKAEIVPEGGCGGNWEGCPLVTKKNGTAVCVPDGGAVVCNKPWYFNRALSFTGNFKSFVKGAQTKEVICEEINANRPLGVRVQLKINPSAGGHFLAITGIDYDSSMLTIDDPYYGRSRLSYEVFVSNYLNCFEWSHTYFTVRKGE